MNDLTTLPPSFKETMKERIIQGFMDLIPREQIDSLLGKEIKAFFETEQMLTVTQTTVEVENPTYDHNRFDTYGNRKTFSKEAMAFGSKMTPFRQLVWSTLHEFLKPKLTVILNNELSTANKALDELIFSKVKPELVDSYKNQFQALSIGMATAMHQQMMRSALQTAHTNMLMSLGAAGMNVSTWPVTPPQSV